MTAILAVIAAVLVVVVGTTAATGWQRHSGDPAAADPSQADVVAGVAAGAVGTSAVSGSGSAPAGGISDLPAPPDAARDPGMRTRPGVVVAHGTDLTVERVDLATATTVDVAGEARDVTSVYRVTVSAGPYPLRDMPAVLSVDGVALGVAAESDDLATLVLFTYDNVVTHAGSTIALTYGLPSEAAPQWSTTIEEQA